MSETVLASMNASTSGGRKRSWRAMRIASSASFSSGETASFSSGGDNSLRAAPASLNGREADGHLTVIRRFKIH